ncbi:Rz1-like lysis system protein LysC [Desulfovibrio falkowii]|uniref:Lipoprotein n=1 Tax=Desulfovibrio falkowii TaxID=3136602 RepID=A0ABQ0EAQ4_9BACT
MMKVFRVGLTALCLTLLCACSKPSPPRIEFVRASPPALLLAPVPMPVPPGTGATNGQLLDYALELEAGLCAANADKIALRGLYKDE